MKLTIQLKDIIYGIIIIALLVFIFKKEDHPEEEYVGRIKDQYDSIVEAERKIHKEAADSFIRLAESRLQVIFKYEEKDSINKYKWDHEISKIKYYTPVRRGFISDSLLIAAGLRKKRP